MCLSSFEVLVFYHSVEKCEIYSEKHLFIGADTLILQRQHCPQFVSASTSTSTSTAFLNIVCPSESHYMGHIFFQWYWNHISRVHLVDLVWRTQWWSELWQWSSTVTLEGDCRFHPIFLRSLACLFCEVGTDVQMFHSRSFFPSHFGDIRCVTFLAIWKILREMTNKWLNFDFISWLKQLFQTYKWFCGGKK